jgi:hypothetical protein
MSQLVVWTVMRDGKRSLPEYATLLPGYGAAV